MFSIIGTNFSTKVFTIDATGTTITTPYTCKSFLLKASGSGIRVRKSSSDAAGDAYIMDDGEILNWDLRLRIPQADNFCTVGFFDTDSGSATLYMVVAY